MVGEGKRKKTGRQRARRFTRRHSRRDKANTRALVVAVAIKTVHLLFQQMDDQCMGSLGT